VAKIILEERHYQWHVLDATCDPEIKRIILSYKLTKAEADFIKGQIIKIKTEIEIKDDKTETQIGLFEL
jgi:hypothetical protein